MDKVKLDERLTAAQRHIAEGEQRILKQEQIIVDLYFSGHNTQDACALLETLRQTQALHIDDRERILNEIAGNP